MNKLVEQKEYNLVVELFEKQIPFFQEVKIKKTPNSIVSPLPYDQVGLVVEALLYMVSFHYSSRCDFNFYNFVQFFKRIQKSHLKSSRK